MQTRRVQILCPPSPSFLYLSFYLPCCHARGKIYTNAGHKIRVFQCPPRECYLADTAEDQCLEFRLFLSFFHSYAAPLSVLARHLVNVPSSTTSPLFLRLFLPSSAVFSLHSAVPVLQPGFFLVSLRFLSPSSALRPPPARGVTQMAE